MFRPAAVPRYESRQGIPGVLQGRQELLSTCQWVRMDCGVLRLAIQFFRIASLCLYASRQKIMRLAMLLKPPDFLPDQYSIRVYRYKEPVGDSHICVGDLIHRLHLIYPRIGIHPGRC